MTRARIPLAAAALAAATASGPAPAQQAPDSAIPWLSDTLRARPIARPPREEEARSPQTPEVTVTSLDAQSRDGVGLVSAAQSGLPADIWAGADPAEVVARLAALPRDMPEPMRRVVLDLLTAELEPPPGTPPDTLFLARIDALLAMGALDRAQALLERAGPTERQAFRRWFDVSLLTGFDERACEAMAVDPDLSPTLPARIFCLTRGGDWPAAALALDTGRALDLLDEDEAELLAWFLDPELFEGEPPPPAPDPLTPLAFRLLDGIGERPDTRGLPLAFAAADLREEAGWKRRIEAAERLVRAGVLGPDRLIALYLERRPSASGGVWERAAAIQRLDAALLSRDAAGVAAALPAAVAEMEGADLLPALGSAWGSKLIGLDLPPAAEGLALRLALLSRDPERAVGAVGPTDARLPVETFGLAVARGADATPPPGTRPAAVAAGLSAEADLPGGGRGMAILRAARLLGSGTDAAPGEITEALALLRAVGLEDAARRLALHLLLA